MTRHLLCSILILMMMSLGAVSVKADVDFLEPGLVVSVDWGGIWVDDSSIQLGQPREVTTGMFITPDQDKLFIRGTDTIDHWEGRCTLVPGDKSQARCRGTGFSGPDRQPFIYQSTFTLMATGEIQEKWKARFLEKEKSGTNSFRRIEVGYSVPDLATR